jgi:LysM repeat protein
MNNPNPFLPQGAFLDQKTKARTRLKIAVFFSISLSVMVLMALLIQGCRKPNDQQVDGSNGSAADAFTNANPPSLSNAPAEIATTSNTAVPTLPPETNVAPPPPVVQQQAPPPPPVAETQDYTIVKGDTYATIAKNNHTTAAAIAKANPGVDARKLKIGQKIHLPAATSSTSTSAAPQTQSATETAAAGGAATYKVKSGDTLTTIAKKNHVTVKAIQAENNLTTTSIKVGQVLKIPGAATAAPAPAPAPVDSMPPPVATPAPAITSAPPAVR